MSKHSLNIAVKYGESIPVYDGAEGLQIFDRDTVDLVVLDIMLPKISGRSRNRWHVWKRMPPVKSAQRMK